jgi:predicted dehydrogenase
MLCRRFAASNHREFSAVRRFDSAMQIRATNSSSGAHYTGSMSNVRWGLIGCGDIARKRVAPALRDAPHSEIAVISRKQAHLAADFAREFSVPKHYEDWRELLQDPHVDAVYIATPADLHAEQTIAAARAGKHVLCEKPMALTVADCGRMIEACAETKVTLGVAYYRRFYAVVRRVKELLESGEIGRPVIAQINAFENFNPAPGQPRHWLLEKEHSGGGPMMDFGCHRVEVLQYLLGPIGVTRPVLANVLFEREVEDTAAAFFEFESGPRGTLTVTHAAFEPRDTLDIFGSDGSIHVPVLNGDTLTVKTRKGERTESHPPHSNVHQPLVEDFVEAVLHKREPEVGGETGRQVQEVLAAIYGRGR